MSTQANAVMTAPNERVRQTPMPENLLPLLVDYPREDWRSHPGFRQPTRNWLGAHRMFRQVSRLVRESAEKFQLREASADQLGAVLSYYGDGLVRSLHGHHGWENRSYFPELRRADARFEDGLKLLEADHATLDGVLDDFVLQANAFFAALSDETGDNALYDRAAPLYEHAVEVETLLARHLEDEEHLAVPIILHHRLRG